MPRPSDLDVLEAVRRLAAEPRTVTLGDSAVRLPGPCTSDLARAVGAYPDQIKPAVQSLLETGKIREQTVGKYRCFLLTPDNESAA
jgi:hypothetical protein